MEVLAIIGSPRKGHSYRVAQQIERRLAQNGAVQFEYVFLSQVNLQACRGCYLCQSRGEQHCPLKDGRADLVQKMQQADGVIFVSPVYTSNVTGLMKNFMDRIAYLAHRPAFLGKPAMLVATGSLETADTLKALAWFGYTGFEIVARLGVAVWPSPHRAWQPGRAGVAKFEQAVRRFERALARRPASMSLGQVLLFYARMATAVTDPTFFVADYAYHQAIDQHGVSVSGWKKALGGLYFWVARQWLGSRLRPVVKGGPSPTDGG